MLRRLPAPALLPALLIGPALLLLGACASDEPGPRHGHGGPGGEHGSGPPGGPARVRLFVSPSGEPFRGEGGLARWFAQVDTDHDGSISLEEFRADARHSFQVLDANHDGVISGLEQQAYEREIVPEIGVLGFEQPEAPRQRRSPIGGPRSSGNGGAPGSGIPGGGGVGGGLGDGSRTDPAQMLADQANAVPKAAGRDGAARFSLLNEPEPIAAADADVDGKVTLAEWMARTDVRFAKLDWQKTGKLTMDSLLHLQPKDQKDDKRRGGPGGPPPKP
ncbi:MAG: EF-hand domain-containing protein [Proteobacteria bacterium]|nr:EF-hand domain-containing protein [Pseudomonadota bacterium]